MNLPMQPILIERRGPFQIITLNRPERRNALTIELIEQLLAGIDSANADATCRAVIVRGAGESFCTGMDLKEAQRAGGHETIARAVTSMLLKVHTSPLVTIAAVHGHAMAGGAGLMTACDLAVASKGALIGLPEVRRGLVPALVSTLLRRQLGERRLRELLLLADPITADRALEWGLINRVVADVSSDGVLNGALALAHALAMGAPGALASTKALLAELRGASLNDELARALAYHDQARGSAEAAEGIAAFVEKRAPKWSS
jgi:methylglutaconyl-CoA hydratase